MNHKTASSSHRFTLTCTFILIDKTMITIDTHPPRFHTLYNPVIFELSSNTAVKTKLITIQRIPLPRKETDIDKEIKAEKDTIQTTIAFEKVSDRVFRARFDARHFLAPLFGALQRPASEVVCDEYQAFQYTIALEGEQYPMGPFTVLRAAAQAGELHDLDQQRHKLLTGLKVLRVYEDYPCDASLLCPDKGSYLYHHPEEGDLEIPLEPNRVNRLKIDCDQESVELKPRITCRGEWEQFVCQETVHDFVFEWRSVGALPNTPVTRYHAAGHLAGSADFDLWSLKDGALIGYSVVESTCPDWIRLAASDLRPDGLTCHWLANDTIYTRTARIELVQAESGKKIYLVVEQERVGYLFRWQEQEIRVDLDDTEVLLHLSVNHQDSVHTKTLHSYKGALHGTYQVVAHPVWISPLDMTDSSLTFRVTRLALGFASRNGRVVLRQDESGKEIELVVDQQAVEENCRGEFENFVCQEVKGVDFIPVRSIDDLNAISLASNPEWLPYVLMNDIDYSAVEFRSLYWEGIRFYGQGFALRNINIGRGQDISVVNCLLRDVHFEQVETRDTGYFLFTSSAEIVNCHFLQIQCVRQWPGWVVYCDTRVGIRHCSFREIDIRATGVPDHTSEGAGYSAVIGMGGDYNVVEDVYADGCLGKVHWNAHYRAGLVSGLSAEHTNNRCRRAVVSSVLLSVPDEISTENTGSGGIASLCEVQDSVLLGGSMQVASEVYYAASAGRIQGHAPGAYPYTQSSNNYASEAYQLLGRTVLSDKNGIDGETIGAAQAQSQAFYESLGYDFTDGWRMGANHYPEPWKAVELLEAGSTPSGHALAQDYRYTVKLGDFVLQNKVYSLLSEFTDAEGRFWPAVSEEEYIYWTMEDVRQRANALRSLLGKCTDYELRNEAVELDSDRCVDYQFEWHPQEIDPASEDDEENLYITVESGTTYEKLVLSFKNNVLQDFEVSSAPDWFIPILVTPELIQFKVAGQPQGGTERTAEVVLTQAGSEQEIYLHITQGAEETCSVEFFDFVCHDESSSLTQERCWVNPLCQLSKLKDAFDQFKFIDTEQALYNTAILRVATNGVYTHRFRNVVSNLGNLPTAWTVDTDGLPTWVSKAQVVIENEAYCVDFIFNNTVGVSETATITLRQTETGKTLDLQLEIVPTVGVVPRLVLDNPVWSNSGLQLYRDLETRTYKNGDLVQTTQRSLINFLGKSETDFLRMDREVIETQAQVFLHGASTLNSVVEENTEACPIIQVERILHIQPLASPRSVVAEKDGYLYLADFYNGLIKVNPSLTDGAARIDFFNKNRVDHERVLQAGTIGNRNGHLFMVPYNYDGMVFDISNEVLVRGDVEIHRKATSYQDDYCRTNRGHVIYLPSVDEFLLINNRNENQGFHVIDPKNDYAVSGCYTQYGIPAFSQETSDGHIYMVTSYVANRDYSQAYNETGYLRKLSSATKQVVLEIPLPKIPVFKLYDTPITGSWYRKDFAIVMVLDNRVFIAATDCMLVYDTDRNEFKTMGLEHTPDQYLLRPGKMGYNPYRDCYYIVGAASYWDGNPLYQLTNKPYLWVYSLREDKIVRTISDFNDIKGAFLDIHYSDHWKNVYLIYDKSGRSSDSQSYDSDHASDGGILVFN